MTPLINTTKTVKMIPNGVSDRYAYAYGYLSGCMRNVEYAAHQMRLRDDPEWIALWLNEIRREIASYKAMDDALHNEHD